MRKIILTASLLAAAQVCFAAPTAELKLDQHGNRLNAQIIVSQQDSTPGTITVHWQAPDKGPCGSSKYPLDYKYKVFHTHAYRTVSYKDRGGEEQWCAGVWKVKVLDSAGTVLASADYTVENKNVDKAEATATKTETK